MSKIQGSDVKGTGDVTSNSRLINTDQLYLTKTAEILDAHLRKNNTTTAAPAVGNDTTQGYEIGSRWWDSTADKEYVALDVSTGAAVWTETTGAGGGGGTTVAKSQAFIGSQSVGTAGVALVLDPNNNSVAENPAGFFNNAGDRFIAPFAGTYLVTLTAYIYNWVGGSTYGELRFLKNGGSLASLRRHYSTSQGEWAVSTYMVDLAVNDYVQIYGVSGTAGTFTLLSSPITICKISDL